ncbi:hypothetical protein K7432_009982 [Basidiobolus ranarum]|uniref:Uncharacterized protein n=1 Tax=Basidiobolus ranarum TaxID=34480 RepID=A0ABR2WPJ4_9FUNG
MGANLNEPLGECEANPDEKIDSGITPLQFALLLHSDIFPKVNVESSVDLGRSEIDFLTKQKYAPPNTGIVGAVESGHLRRRTIQVLPSHKTPSLSSSYSALDSSETGSISSLSEIPNESITFPIPEFLIHNGVDVNSRSSKDGVSALHLVASKGDLFAVRYLLGKGADSNDISGADLSSSTAVAKLSASLKKAADTASSQALSRALKNRVSTPCMHPNSQRLSTSKLDRLSVAGLFK